MFKRTKLAVGLSVVCGGVLLSASTLALAQQQQLERVEITGSAIKRIDAETSVPVTVLKVEDLKREGVTTIEQVIGRITAAQSSQGTSQSVGSGTGGASFADLRGIGANKTLILLNGRRIANNAFDSSATDINMIPFAALERVEVLRDGASALYGTDAIGGVINFITKKSFTGGTVTIGADAPVAAGGKSYNFNAGLGYGDLDKDRFNVLGVIDYQKQDPLTAAQRDFGSTGIIPNRGVDRTSGTSFPANYTQSGVAGGSNPTLPGCLPPYSRNLGSATSCRYDFTRWVDLVPENERMSFFGKASAKLGDDHVASLEYFRTSNINTTVISPVPQTGLRMPNTSQFYPGNGITPLPNNTGVFAFDPALPINVNWRSAEAGGRQGETENVQQRVIAQLEGVVAGWDYQTGLFYNTNELTDKLTGGYNNDALISAGVRDGILNPFGPQDTAGTAYLRDAALRGNLQTGKGTVYGVDARVGSELGDWFKAGRSAAVAFGAEFRKEEFENIVNIPVAEQASSTGLDASGTQNGDRDVTAFYGELNVPLTKELELTAALRHDRYSDFGNTTNPKIGFRYQPVQSILARGSYSTGFRAPSLYELYAPRTLTFTGNAYDDPVLCPGGVPAAGSDPNRDCNQQFLIQRGGNLALEPEKAKNLTFGFVFEPVADLTLGIDFWWIKVENQISQLPEQLIFNDPVKYADRYQRAADGSLNPDGLPNPGFVISPNENLGDLNTNGIDVSASYRLRVDGSTFTFGFNGTFVDKYEYQRSPGAEFVQNRGVFIDAGPIFRWQQAITLNWNSGAWGAGMVHRYKSSYEDENFVDDQYLNRVRAYYTVDVFGSWEPMKGVSLIAGIRNLMDQDPPFSNQGGTFQTGYDPRFTDPLGRTFYARAGYSF